MNFYEFILALSFSQWIGVIILCGIVMLTVVGVAENLPKIFKNH